MNGLTLRAAQRLASRSPIDDVISPPPATRLRVFVVVFILYLNPEHATGIQNRRRASALRWLCGRASRPLPVNGSHLIIHALKESALSNW